MSSAFTFVVAMVERNIVAIPPIAFLLEMISVSGDDDDPERLVTIVGCAFGANAFAVIGNNNSSADVFIMIGICALTMLKSMGGDLIVLIRILAGTYVLYRYVIDTLLFILLFVHRASTC